MSTFSERVPPQDINAEGYVLGSCMVDRDAIPVVQKLLDPEDFYSSRHTEIFRAIANVSDRKVRVDIGTVQSELQNMGHLDDIGGLPALLSLMNEVPSAVNAAAYAQIVADKAHLRRIQTAARQINDDCYTATDAKTMRADALSLMQQAVFSGTQDSAIKQVGKHLLERIEQASNDRSEGRANRNIVPTSFKDMDKRMPLERGTVTIVPSPSGIGKTTWMFQLLIGTARLGEPTIGFSLEMSETQILQKVWANVARLNTMKVRHLSLSDAEWTRSVTEAAQLWEVPFHYALKRRMRFADIRLETLAFKAKHGKLGIIAIDYWQIIGDRPLRDERKDEMFGRLVEDAKDLAVECNCHVVILAQAKIDSTRPIPSLEDVKESRAIVAAADNILFLTRPTEFGSAEIKLPAMNGRDMIKCKCDEPDPNIPSRGLFENVMLGIPGKARMGPKDIIPFYVELETGRMADLARPWPWANPRSEIRRQEV